ncbi:hypothetical protein J2Y89_000249 [Curtobacterium herbarum]|uniref:hypothetical protein n=1 Tax=Curtobacterium sp. PsM8 TaxID=3030532 RepID=UPI00263ADD02|nr:hypothetical protein [Curtobacterium sp. PsM8]MCP1501505.1 hypothetical protein [Curtobacterium herbarum]MDN4649292.1 hypothetical protein [Curtobacterium sp. PsM8]
MTTYESNHDVEPIHVTTYRSARKAARRGWAVPTDIPVPSLDDLWCSGATERTRRR